MADKPNLRAGPIGAGEGIQRSSKEERWVSIG
jgi:hypothetical protein